jgi:DNA mismatch repair protein MutS
MDILPMERACLTNLNGVNAYSLTDKRGRPGAAGYIMEIDQTTYDDLSIFSSEGEFSVFQKLDFTRTVSGRARLLRYFSEPFSHLKPILETQQILSVMQAQEAAWPLGITNGTVMVMEKPDSFLLNALSYKVLHSGSFSLVRYSVKHFADFIRDMNRIISHFDNERSPRLLRDVLGRVRKLLENEVIDSLGKTDPEKMLSTRQVVRYGAYIKNRFRDAALELLDIYGRLDAWYAMARAVTRHRLSYPVFVEQELPKIQAAALFHILLEKPVAYDVRLDKSENFLFLTGANMAGKSTFIKAVGISVYLAHLGMGVPALDMQLTLFDGILSNINVEDNIARGESFFFNEVQRVKNTILKINNSRKWLVLIDELFKGTNMEDAMKCSSTVIRGLIRIQHSLFVLSTHLYDIGEELRQFPNVRFKYFETTVRDDQFSFSYQLKEGISKDRLGYLILKREKVVEMLEEL